jgi:hypothetical protein
MNNPIHKDDIVLILRPNFEGEDWNGTVDLNLMCMPSEKLNEDSYRELMGLMHGIITCFHLLNQDEDFGVIVAEEMDRMVKSGELQFRDLNEDPSFSNVVDLTQWTQTRGNA